MHQLQRCLSSKRVSLAANLIKLDVVLDQPPVMKTTLPLIPGNSLSGLKLKGILEVIDARCRSIGSNIYVNSICQRTEQATAILEIGRT